MAQGSDRPVVGFIGAGLMGHGMAANILAAGYPLRVMAHRKRASVDDLVAQGAAEAASPRAVAEGADIVQLCLPDSDAVAATLRGPLGVLAGARPGLIVIDTTTADPAMTETLVAEAAAEGVTLVDAPLGRTPREAEAGTLDAMVGADDATFETIRPVIETWAGQITRTGPVGSGHKMKLIMNLISMGYAALYAEALSLAVQSGLAPQTVRDVIGGSRLSNGFFDSFMAYAVGRDPEAHRFTIANAAKDVRYAARMADAACVMNPVGAATRQYFAHAEATGHGADYVPTLADRVAALNGFDLARAVGSEGEAAE